MTFQESNGSVYLDFLTFKTATELNDRHQDWNCMATIDGSTLVDLHCKLSTIMHAPRMKSYGSRAVCIRPVIKLCKNHIFVVICTQSVLLLAFIRPMLLYNKWPRMPECKKRNKEVLLSSGSPQTFGVDAQKGGCIQGNGL